MDTQDRILHRRIAPRLVIVIILAVLALFTVFGTLNRANADVICPDLDFVDADLLCPPVEVESAPDPSTCDGGRESRRFNQVGGDFERNFCSDLYHAVPTQDPFDKVFGHSSGVYGWDYGQAIAHLLGRGYSAAQLSTFEGQVQALISEGLWDPETQDIPPSADLSFLATPPGEAGTDVIPNLPLF